MATKKTIDDNYLKSLLRSKDDPSHPICRNRKKKAAIFTFASTIMKLNGTPYLLITAGPPDESDYQKVEFTK